MVRLGYYRPVTVLQQRIIWIMAYTSAGIRYNKYVWSTQIAISRLANVGIWLATSLCHHWQITTSLPQHHVAHRTNVMSNTWRRRRSIQTYYMPTCYQPFNTAYFVGTWILFLNGWRVRGRWYKIELKNSIGLWSLALHQSLKTKMLLNTCLSSMTNILLSVFHKKEWPTYI